MFTHISQRRARRSCQSAPNAAVKRLTLCGASPRFPSGWPPGLCGSGKSDGSKTARPLWRGPAAMLALSGAALAAESAAAESFYLRGGFGLERPAAAAFADVDCQSASPAALYGCGRASDGSPRRSAGSIANPSVFELGVGYNTGNALRLELSADYRPSIAFSGKANFLAPDRRQSYAVNGSSVSAMLAGYFDIPGLGEAGSGPFVGAGIGVAEKTTAESRIEFPATSTVVPGGSHTDTVWMITAGWSVPVGDGMTLDLAWRYTDLGEMRTGAGKGKVVWRDGSRSPIPLNLAPTSAEFKSHGLRLSLRYRF